MESFIDHMTEYEGQILREACSAAKSQSYDVNMSQKVISVLSRYGCMSLPKLQNSTDLIYQCAIYELYSKPSAAINEMRKEIEPVKKFWQPLYAEDLTLIYTSLLPTPEKVLKLIDDSDPCSEYGQILGYLRQYVGNMSKQSLQTFSDMYLAVLAAQRP